MVVPASRIGDLGPWETTRGGDESQAPGARSEEQSDKEEEERERQERKDKVG